MGDLEQGRDDKIGALPIVLLICCVFLGLATLGVVIMVFACIQELAPDEQLLIADPAGHWVKNGPWRGVLINFYPKEKRNGIVLQPEEYVLVQNKMTGRPRHESGPKLLFLDAYDEQVSKQEKIVLHKEQFAIVKNDMSGLPRHEIGPKLLYLNLYDRLIEIRPKVVLQKDQYIRLVDQVTGTERVVRGPLTFVPEPLENSTKGVERAVFLDTDSAALVLDRRTGLQRLVTDQLAFAPAPLEEILEVRELIHIMPHEAVVTRDAGGSLEVHTGTEGAGNGISFFLQPYHEIVEMEWSEHSEVALRRDNGRTGGQVRKKIVRIIDLRARKMFFEYEVRTSDNVKLELEGTIFYQVVDVGLMIGATSDPEGDVWHHARSALIEAVSNTTLSAFMAGFNRIVMDAFRRQAEDGFYAERGVEMQSMEVTSFDCADSRTAQILQEIIQETTNRINRLTAQESENDVQAAALRMDIQLEKQRTELISTRAENNRLQSRMAGEAEGMKLVRGAATFIGGLNESLPNVSSRVELYRMHENLRSKNLDTQNLASGKAHLFLTPEDLRLKLNVGGGSAQTMMPEL